MHLVLVGNQHVCYGVDQSVSSHWQLSVHVLFHRLCLHFNCLWRDVGAHACCPLCLCLGVRLLSELLQPGWRPKKKR